VFEVCGGVGACIAAAFMIAVRRMGWTSLCHRRGWCRCSTSEIVRFWLSGPDLRGSVPAELGFREPKLMEQRGELPCDRNPGALGAFGLGELAAPALQRAWQLERPGYLHVERLDALDQAGEDWPEIGALAEQCLKPCAAFARGGDMAHPEAEQLEHAPQLVGHGIARPDQLLAYLQRCAVDVRGARFHVHCLEPAGAAQLRQALGVVDIGLVDPRR